MNFSSAETSVLDAVRTSALTKRYGERIAVDNLDWVVPAGGITGLLGPNGAGKTTTLKMLFGLAHPTSGSARVLGADVATQGATVRHEAAFVTAENEAPGWMRAGQLAAEYGTLFADWDLTVVNRLAKRWAVPLDAKVRTLSRGTRCKLLLAMALARRPHLLVLDEPTDGLDPAGVEDVLGYLVDIAANEGTAVVLSTHRLEEVERVCDRVTILANGKLMVDGDADTLRGERGMSIREIYLSVTNYEERHGDGEAPPLRDGLA
jgi:ABC-2 type transport system ATP-binding protein